MNFIRLANPDFLRSYSNSVSEKYPLGVLAFGILALFYGIFRVLYLLYFHPLSKVPGPLLAKLTNLWQAYYVARLVKAVKVQGKVLLGPPNIKANVDLLPS
jgi:hypothetical protein